MTSIIIPPACRICLIWKMTANMCNFHNTSSMFLLNLLGDILRLNLHNQVFEIFVVIYEIFTRLNIPTIGLYRCCKISQETLCRQQRRDMSQCISSNASLPFVSKRKVPTMISEMSGQNNASTRIFKYTRAVANQVSLMKMTCDTSQCAMLWRWPWR